MSASGVVWRWGERSVQPVDKTYFRESVQPQRMYKVGEMPVVTRDGFKVCEDEYCHQSRPQLYFDCIARSSHEAFDVEELFETSEEQLYLPSGSVKFGDGINESQNLLEGNLNFWELLLCCC